MDIEPILRMLLAAGLSLPVGLDRELRGKPAGLRTHVVVATASAALGYVSVAAAAGQVGTDQARIAAQVVSGIGFMGAGVIFASGGRVHGLTTAAALWSASATGLCVGLGADALAFALVLVTMLFLWPVDQLSRRLLGQHTLEERFFHIVADDLDAIAQAQSVLSRNGALSREISLSTFGDRIGARVMVRCRGGQARRIVQDLGQLTNVSFVSDEALDRAGD